MLTHDGLTMCATDWAKKLRVSPKTFSSRIASKCPPERLFVKGKCRHRWSKLSASQVIEIRRMVLDGEIQRRVAKEFSVTPATVCNIVSGKTWNHL